MAGEQEDPNAAAAAAPERKQSALSQKQPKKYAGCFPFRKEVVEVPLFDDVNCPYGIKPTELFQINEDKDMEKLQALGGVTGLAGTLQSHSHSGLDPSVQQGPASIEEHRRVYGANTMPPMPQKNFFMLCFENIQDPIILLLIAAALVSTVLGAALEEQRKEGEWIEGIAIWVAVAIVIMVGAGNDYQKDLQFRKLNKQKDIIDVTVTRGGQPLVVANTDLVVGDVLMVNMGDKVVADGIMIDGFHLVVDEASLTGESDPIKKNPEEDPWVRSGTQISEGSGRILVVAVGTQSEWGKTMQLVGNAGSEDTPLQEKLADLAAAIGKIGFGVAVACFIALLIKWCVENRGFPLSKINQNGPVQFFLYAVTIVVVAVPEGLPLAVTIALAYSMKKMMRDNNFVRVLAACETMGGATAICSDKTGTLTENRMTVVEGWFSGVKLDHAPTPEELRPELLQELSLNACLNGKAFLIEHGDLLEFVGNRTECALLVLARKWGINYQKVREEYESKTAEVYAFTSAKKMASILIRRDDSTLRLYNKGAAEWVLKRCVSLHNEYGEVVPMTEAIREDLLQTVVGMASRGLRCICLTYRDYPTHDASRAADFFEDADRVDSDLIAMAIVGIKDPVRAEVPHAVQVCQNAGIRVRMVTGDNIHTARHIARDCGILTDEGVALEGPVFRNMPAHDLLPLLPKLQVLARSSPEDKLTLVSMLKKEGEVVAVTGDGTNDAPALKESDVGLAMGIAGTEVAKEAADIVIMDDNFTSIVKAVLWGRSVFNSIRKFLQFQLTVNFVALVVAFVGAIIGGRIPLNVLQLLWVNLIMDTMGALALATEDPNPDLLNDKPHGRDESLITIKMWKHILTQGLYQMFWLFFFMYAAPVLFAQYRITDNCTYIAMGPDENNAGWCAQHLVSGQGISAEHAAFYCGAMSGCGFAGKCENTLRQVASACPFVALMPAGQPVPGDAGSAFAAAFPNGACPPSFGGSCPTQDGYNSAVNYMEKGYFHEAEEDWIKADSVLFNAFIFLQLFNEINARRIKDELNVFKDIHRSPIFIGVLLVTAGLQVIIMQTPVGRFFKVHPINGVEWAISVAIGISAIPVSILVRLVSRWCTCLPSPTDLRGRRRRGRRTASGGSRIHNEAVALARLSPEKRASRELKGGGSVNSSVNSRLSNSSPVRHASHNSSSAVAVPKAV